MREKISSGKPREGKEMQPRNKIYIKSVTESRMKGNIQKMSKIKEK